MNLSSKLALAVLALTSFSQPAQLNAQNVYATPYTFTTIAGHPACGARDGTGTEAQFSQPVGIATDPSGSIYVADAGGHSIRKITPAGVVSTLAGGNYGSADGTGSAAQFGWLFGLAVDATGNVYASDSTYHTIRKITPAGVVTTFAGSPGVEGSTDGSGSAARFKSPGGLAVDAAGNLYLADSLNHTIRKITPGGVVSTLAGSPGAEGLVDGTGSAARFSTPRAVTIDSSGNLVVIDYIHNLLRKITPAGVVSTFAGNGQSGSTDGSASEASFFYPMGLTADGSGNVYVVDTLNRTIRKITSTGVVSTLAGSAGAGGYGYVDGTGSAARFADPYGIAVDASDNLYIADTGNHAIRKLAAGNVVTTLAGAVGSEGTADGSGTTARFSGPQDVAVSPSGVVYVADFGNCTIRKIATNGEVSLFAGAVREYGTSDGTGDTARFTVPFGLALDTEDNLFVADGAMVRKISATAIVTTLPYRPSEMAVDVAVDTAGSVFVADQSTFTIRKITPAGEITIFAGSAGNRGATDGTGSDARFYGPTGITIDASGRLFVADRDSIRMITSAGVVTTIAGGSTGSRDGTGSEAQFGYLSHLAVDGSGNLFVTDPINNLIRKVTPNGVVTTIAGSLNSPGSADGTGAASRFAAPYGIAVDNHGALYVADVGNNTIRKGVAAPKATPALTWSNPSPITYGTVLSSTQLNATASVAGTFAYTSASGTVLEAGAHTLSVTFTPTDTTSYNTATAQVSLTVQAATPTITWTPPTSLVYGTALSSTQHNATASVPGTFTYSPAAGTVLSIGATTLRATFAPNDTRNYTTATAEVSLLVVGQTLAGTYFGTFANNHGHWALRVNSDNTAVYLAFLTSRGSAVIVHLTINADGTFTTTGTETVSLSIGASAQARSLASTSGTARPLAAASAFTLSGQISSGTLTGQLTGLGETFSGTIDAASGTAPSGYYTASALNTASGSTYAIVAPSGQALVVIASTTLDSASGTVGSNGQFTATTAAGGQLAVTLNTSARSLAAALTPSGSTTPISFAGLADTATSTTRLVNLSARALCRTGNSVTIGGFVVSGSAQKRVLIRAVGPTLTTQGISATEVLADPTIEVHRNLNGSDTIVAANDNWTDAPNAADLTTTAQSLGAFSLDSADTKSSAILTSLDAGAYSFIVKGKNDSAGIVLLEIYDADAATPTATFANLSARARDTTGNGVTIGGFVVTGNAPKRFLLRAVGPTLPILTANAITTAETLADPVIELHTRVNDADTTLATIDNWTDRRSDNSTTAARLGGFALDSSDTKSAALVTTLQPGAYSFVVKGQSDTSGIVLIEIYDAD